MWDVIGSPAARSWLEFKQVLSMHQDKGGSPLSFEARPEGTACAVSSVWGPQADVRRQTVRKQAVYLRRS